MQGVTVDQLTLHPIYDYVTIGVGVVLTAFGVLGLIAEAKETEPGKRGTLFFLSVSQKLLFYRATGFVFFIGGFVLAANTLLNILFD